MQSLLQTGDVIFRNGTDDISQAARKFNRKDTSYSHCGILAIEDGHPVVYHALGGSFNPSQHLMREPLSQFCNPLEFDKVAVYRYPFTPLELDALHQTIKTHHKNKLPFDVFFNFETDDRMYCSEFVYKSLNQAAEGKLSSLLPPHQDPVYIAIDDLFLNNRIRLIKKIKF